MTDYEQFIEQMPCDEELLGDLGRVTWAAARLHAGVRDALNAIDGTPSDSPFRDYTLGQAIAALEQRARSLNPSHRDAILQWCQDTGRPANGARNKVAHAVAYTADDGRQAIRTHDHSDPGCFLRPQLRHVAGQLVHASATLPAPPYN